MTHWRRKARGVIVEALKEGRAQGLEGKALVAFVDARYPFGERENWPYKIWLDERRVLVLGKPHRPEARAKKGPPVVPGWPGLTPEQRTLFGMTEE